MLSCQGIAVHCENTNLASMAVGLRRFSILLIFFAFLSASFTGQEGKSRTWQLWIVTWRGCTGTCSGLTRSPSLWSGTPPSGSTFYLKSKLLSFLLLSTSSHHHFHQTCDHQVLMPTSSRLIVLQGDKERHIHWVGGQPGGVDCGEFAVGEAACGQLYPFLFIWKGQLSSILCCQDCWLVGYISIEDAVRS